LKERAVITGRTKTKDGDGAHGVIANAQIFFILRWRFQTNRYEKVKKF
jgi:hypothetical protein